MKGGAAKLHKINRLTGAGRKRGGYSSGTSTTAGFCYAWNIVGNLVSKGYSRHPWRNGGAGCPN